LGPTHAMRGNKLTPAERKQAFDALYDALPGSNADKVRTISRVLFCKPNTVRIWHLKAPTRIIPEAKLRMLMREFGAGQNRV